MMLDLNRLSRVIAMFDSPVDHERVAAFLRADAMIVRAGRQWRDTMPALFGTSVRLVRSSHIEQCRDALRTSNSHLTAWERGFLFSLCGTLELTKPQADRLTQVLIEVDLRREAEAEFGVTTQGARAREYEHTGSNDI